MDSANVLIVEWFRLEGTFEHHLVLSPPKPPFSWLNAGCTLWLYEIAESRYSRAVKPQVRQCIHVWSHKYWAEGSSHLPHLLSVLVQPGVHTHPWLVVNNHITFVLKLIFYADSMFSFPWIGKLEQCCHLGFANILHWMLKQAMLAFIQKL